ncbi:Peroxisomal biogenesis factor 3 [Lamellibrachia satsuma]|nr:Peroxisomal biogenesis factor 3 [Lamellibrachia satsuma]
MFSGIWNFVKRHKRKIIFTGALVGGALWLGKFAHEKLNDFQEDESAEYLLQARKQHHFDSNQRTCNMTALSMLPSLREVLMCHLDSESLTARLRSNPANKLDIWEELKIIGFSRTVTAVYISCVVVVVLRVQLNILGGYMYLDTLPKNDGISDNTVATSSVQQQYLGTIQCLLGKGLVDMIAAVRKSVKNVVGSTSLKHQMSLPGIQTAIGDIRKQLECSSQNRYHQGSPLSSLCQYVMSTVVENGTPEGAVCLSRDDLTFQKLLRETQDVLDSSDFHTVLRTCLDTAFSRIVDRIAEYFKPASQQNGTVFNPIDIKMPLAKVIPIMNGLLFTVCGNTPNPIVQELLLKEPLRTFAANIYEAFSQTEPAVTRS